jgi:hypothetical protein
MPTFKDPVTNTNYDLGDPSGTLMDSVGIVGGIAMTAFLALLALNQVLPWVQGLFSGVTGINSSGDTDLQLGA